MMKGSTIWLAIGFLGQAMFFMRFLVQWVASERSRRSVDATRLLVFQHSRAGWCCSFTRMHQRDVGVHHGPSDGFAHLCPQHQAERQPKSRRSAVTTSRHEARARSGWDGFGPYLLLVLMFCVSMAFRPLLPVDETRYLSVAWEMLLQRSFLVPTLEFRAVFPEAAAAVLAGRHRLGAGRGRPGERGGDDDVSVSALVIWLTRAAWRRRCFRTRPGSARRVAWLVVGSAGLPGLFHLDHVRPDAHRLRARLSCWH